MSHHKRHKEERAELNSEFDRAFPDRKVFKGAEMALKAIIEREVATREDVEDFLKRLMRDGYTMGAMRERLGKHRNPEEYE